MDQNAFVCWLETPEPWLVETELIRSVILPLNLDENTAHPFHANLTASRRLARQSSDQLPIWQG